MTSIFSTSRKTHVQRAPFLRHWAVILMALCGIGICGWVGRGFLLRGIVSWWAVSDPLTRADAIVVLGGNFHVRPRMAADLFQRGVANKILISQTGNHGQKSIIAPTDTDLNRAALLELGVPNDAIKTFGFGNLSTRDEAIALGQWAQRNGGSIFIIPSEMLSARRVQWIFRRELSDMGIQVEVGTLDRPEYSIHEWWKSEHGLLAFRDEFMKYMYYRLKY